MQNMLIFKLLILNAWRFYSGACFTSAHDPVINVPVSTVEFAIGSLCTKQAPTFCVNNYFPAF